MKMKWKIIFLHMLKKILVLFKKSISKTDEHELYSHPNLNLTWKNYETIDRSFLPADQL